MARRSRIRLEDTKVRDTKEKTTMPLSSNGADAGLYSLSIYKYRSGAPEKQWVNTYELDVGSGLTFNATLTMMLNFVAFEKFIHSGLIVFDRAVLSTWQADTTPYNADEFLSLPLTGTGSRFVSGDLLPLEVAVLVRRAVASGRAGKLFYRGCLGEGEVNAPGGVIQFSSGAFSSRFDSGVTNIAPYTATGGPAPQDVRLVMINRNSANQTIIRHVAALQLVSPRIRSRSARWHNRRS